MSKQRKHRSAFLTFLIVGVGVTGISKGTDSVGIPCGVVTKVGHGAQIIPPHGKVQVKFEVDQPVVCGSMVITHHETVWVRHSNQTIYKIAPDSFFELGLSKDSPNRLYRGEMLVSAPPGVAEEFVTLNGKIKFTGGVAWIQYEPKDKETSAASFNRSFIFGNKFNEKATQEVRVGEISRLKLGDPRVVPTQAEVIHVASVKEVISHFGLTDADQDEMSKIVERVYETRAKTLTADIENWKETEQEKGEPVKRSIASVPSQSKPALDDAEAEHTMELFKKKVYGEEDLNLLEEDRKPASASGAPLSDPLYEREKKSKAAEAKKVVKEISDLKTD